MQKPRARKLIFPKVIAKNMHSGKFVLLLYSLFNIFQLYSLIVTKIQFPEKITSQLSSFRDKSSLAQKKLCFTEFLEQVLTITLLFHFNVKEILFK